MSNDNANRIEAYLDGTMDLEARTAFEEEMDNYPLLLKEVQFQQNLIKDLKRKQVPMNKAQLMEIWREVKGNKRVKQRRLIRNVLLAAAVMTGVVFFIGISYLLPSGNVADQYFDAYPITILRDAKLQDFEKQLTQASQAYQQKNYNEALLLLNEMPDSLLQREDLILYRGICYYKTNQYQEASTQFNALLSKSKLWDEHARWYLMLCYLKLENKDSAITLLKQITNIQNHFKLKEANELLKKIE